MRAYMDQEFHKGVPFECVDHGDGAEGILKFEERSFHLIRLLSFLVTLTLML